MADDGYYVVNGEVFDGSTATLFQHRMPVVVWPSARTAAMNYAGDLAQFTGHPVAVFHMGPRSAEVSSPTETIIVLPGSNTNSMITKQLTTAKSFSILSLQRDLLTNEIAEATSRLIKSSSSDNAGLTSVSTHLLADLDAMMVKLDAIDAKLAEF